MADFSFYNSNVVGVSVRANMSSSAQAYTFVGSGISVVSTTDRVITGSGDEQTITIFGTVMSVARGAAQMTGNDGDTIVHEGAVLQGVGFGTEAALELSGTGQRADIRGTVLGADGIALGEGGHAVISGEVSGIGSGAAGRGMVLAMTGSTGATVEVTGVLRGDTAALVAEGAGTGAVHLDNSGRITGDVTLGAGDDVITNTGLVQGDIHVGPGVNSYTAGADAEVTGTVYGGDDYDTFRGGDAADRFVMGNRIDVAHGNGGDDYIDGGFGNDYLYGQTGDDTLIGGRGVDLLQGGHGDDLLDGGAENDTLRGGRDNDTMDAGSGDDLLDGGFGHDVMTGGGGIDTFVFRRHSGDDTITDFTAGTDLLDLSYFGLADYTALQSSGALSETTAHVAIDFALIGGTGHLVLDGVALGDLSAGDFLF